MYFSGIFLFCFGLFWILVFRNAYLIAEFKWDWFENFLSWNLVLRGFGFKLGLSNGYFGFVF